MTRPATSVPPWTALTASAVACVLVAAVTGIHAELSIAAACLGLGAVATWGVARNRDGLPCAAVACLGAGAVAAVLAWGLGKDHYPFGWGLAVFQLLTGLVLLPGHLRRSGSRSVAAARAEHGGG
ncbi:hypothetical protein [Streptomyces sp. NPDC002215]|uniref:hypothetical protein n=1 Tax=Streptomyces sp. NPDC002215 TaxID=3154412 RepID=UPI00331C2488